MFNFRIDQLEEMVKLIDFHLERHRELQPIQAIQEMSELTQELTNYLIRIKLKKDVNYLNLYNELFDTIILLMTMYKMFVMDFKQENMFMIIADQKINREKTRWSID